MLSICDSNFYDKLKDFLKIDPTKYSNPKRLLQGLSGSDYDMERTIGRMLDDYIKPIAVTILFDFDSNVFTLSNNNLKTRYQQP